jgi:hypothetical protein
MAAGINTFCPPQLNVTPLLVTAIPAHVWEITWAELSPKAGEKSWLSPTTWQAGPPGSMVKTYLVPLSRALSTTTSMLADPQLRAAALKQFRTMV